MKFYWNFNSNKISSRKYSNENIIILYNMKFLLDEILMKSILSDYNKVF